MKLPVSEKDYDLRVYWKTDMLTCTPCGMHTKTIYHSDGAVDKKEYRGFASIITKELNGELRIPSCKHRKWNI